MDQLICTYNLNHSHQPDVIPCEYFMEKPVRRNFI